MVATPSPVRSYRYQRHLAGQREGKIYASAFFVATLLWGGGATLQRAAKATHHSIGFEIIMGCIFWGPSLFFFSILLRGRLRSARRLDLMAKGKKITAKVIRFERTPRIGSSETPSDNQSATFVLAEWQDPKTGLSYRFRSERIWVDLGLLFGDKLPAVGIWIDPENPHRYAFDVEGLLAATE